MGTFLLVSASALWGLLHSLTASVRTKGIIQKAFGTSFMNWYRFLYNLLSGVTFLPLFALVALLPDVPFYTIPVPWLYFTSLIQLLAVVVLVAGVLQTDVWSFIGLRQIFAATPDAKIVTKGLYRYVRHPLYSAGLVFIWLTPAMTLNRVILFFCLTFYIFVGAYFEERKLVREYGQDYLEYRASTPMLIPLSFRSKQKI